VKVIGLYLPAGIEGRWSIARCFRQARWKLDERSKLLLELEESAAAHLEYRTHFERRAYQRLAGAAGGQ